MKGCHVPSNFICSIPLCYLCLWFSICFTLGGTRDSTFVVSAGDALALFALPPAFVPAFYYDG